MMALRGEVCVAQSLGPPSVHNRTPELSVPWVTRSSSPNMRLCRASILLERWPVKFEEVQDHLPVPAAVHSLKAVLKVAWPAQWSTIATVVDHRLGSFSS